MLVAGVIPSSLFQDKLNCSKHVRQPIDSGIGPCSELLDRSKLIKFTRYRIVLTSVGIRPYSMLSCKFNFKTCPPISTEIPYQRRYRSSESHNVLFCHDFPFVLRNSNDNASRSHIFHKPVVHVVLAYQLLSDLTCNSYPH